MNIDISVYELRELLAEKERDETPVNAVTHTPLCGRTLYEMLIRHFPKGATIPWGEVIEQSKLQYERMSIDINQHYGVVHKPWGIERAK